LPGSTQNQVNSTAQNSTVGRIPTSRRLSDENVSPDRAAKRPYGIGRSARGY
jgi:hypothetical protein